MAPSTERTRALQPWLALCAACEAAQPFGASTQPAQLARARRVLLGLQAGDVPPVPAWIAGEDPVLDADGRARSRRPARALRQMWADRDAVLRLGLWAALRRLAQAQAPLPGSTPGGTPFDALMAALSQVPDGQAPVLRPSHTHGADAGFAHSAEAALFFNGRLRQTLANLAALYDSRGAQFGRWLSLPRYEPGGGSAERWAQAWSLVVVATYLDWLHRASGGALDVALALVFDDTPRRFRPPARVIEPAADAAAQAPRPAVLPTHDKRMHFELLLQVVLAQVLDHDTTRWAALARGARRFVVALSMKALDQADTRRHDAALAELRNFTIYRGLTIAQVYMAAVVQRLFDPAEPR